MRSPATLADLVDIAPATVFVNLTSGLTAGEQVNTGGFTVETASQRDDLVIANAGTYTVLSSMIGDTDAVSTGTDRGVFTARLARTRGGIVEALAPEGIPTYNA